MIQETAGQNLTVSFFGGRKEHEQEADDLRPGAGAGYQHEQYGRGTASGHGCEAGHGTECSNGKSNGS